MTTSLEAMKAAREALGRSLLRLRGPGDRDYAEACDYALALLDAAIQRISDCETCDGTGVCYSEWPVRDSDGGMCDIDGEEHPCPDCCAAIQREEGGGETERPSLECEPERVELGGVRDALSLKHVSDERLDDLCREAGLYDEAQPPSGVVSREALETPTSDELVRRFHEMPSCPHADPDVPRWHQVGHEHSGDVFCSLCIGNLLACAYEDGQESAAVLSAPSEPMVPRARAMEAILDALTFDARWPDEAKDLFDRWRRETADRIAARILDGEARDGE